jgi:glycine betaine/proline transport system permease protein
MDHITQVVIPLDDWIEFFVKDWLVPNFRGAFRAIEWPIDRVLQNFDALLQATPPIVFLIVVSLFAWRLAGRGVAIFTAIAILLFDALNVWPETMTTLAMVLTSVAFCVIVGVPVGIVAARSDKFWTVLRPILDIMQTVPAFVYLVPIVMLFGVGLVPGIVATIIFAMPPLIRLTNLGIRQVQRELVEAGIAFGSTPRQVLWDIQVPLAMNTIMAGLNQTLMLSLSMVVIAALIGAGGLGLTVLSGINKLDVGAASLGGIGIVLMAIILDRITQALGAGASRRKPGWTFKGFLSGLLRFPRTVAEALGGDAPARRLVLKAAASVVIIVALGVWMSLGGEPTERQIAQAWTVERGTGTEVTRKRECTRPEIFESGYVCSFYYFDKSTGRRHIGRNRFVHSSETWTMLKP